MFKIRILNDKKDARARRVEEHQKKIMTKNNKKEELKNIFKEVLIEVLNEQKGEK